MNTRITRIEEDIVCFTREYQYCIDSDCGGTIIDVYCRKKEKLTKEEQEILKQYMRSR